MLLTGIAYIDGDIEFENRRRIEYPNKVFLNIFFLNVDNSFNIHQNPHKCVCAMVIKKMTFNKNLF